MPLDQIVAKIQLNTKHEYFDGLNEVWSEISDSLNRVTLFEASNAYSPFPSSLQHYWIQVLCRVPEALGKGQIALGKAFAECDTGQRTHGKKLIGKALFTECLLSGTRQRLCRVPR